MVKVSCTTKTAAARLNYSLSLYIYICTVNSVYVYKTLHIIPKPQTHVGRSVFGPHKFQVCCVRQHAHKRRLGVVGMPGRFGLCPGCLWLGRLFMGSAPIYISAPGDYSRLGTFLPEKRCRWPRNESHIRMERPEEIVTRHA